MNTYPKLPKFLIATLMPCLIFIGIYPLQVAAQNQEETTWGFTTGIATGYESNILRSPASYVLDGDTLSKEDLWRTAWRNDVTFNPDLDYRKGKHRLKASTDFNARLYQGHADANLYSWTTGMKYLYKLNKKATYFGQTDYRFNRRAVQPENEDILQLPDSYDRITWETGLKLRPGNWHFAEAGFFGTFKQFRSDAENPTRYMDIGAWVGDRHKVKKPGKRDRQFSWEARWRERFYGSNSTEVPFNQNEEGFGDNFEDGPTGTGEHWRVVQIFGDYELPLGKYAQLNPSVRLRNRQDVRDTVATFREIGMGMGMGWEKGKLKLTARTGYQFRHYPGLLVTDDGERVPLRYQYLRSSLRVKYALNDHLDLNTSLTNWSRISNNTRPGSRVRRSFSNTAFMAGINYTF